MGNMAVEIEAQPGNDPGTEYGILFRYDAKQDSKYLFGVTLDGQYYVIKWVGGRHSDNDPVPGRPTSLLKPGSKNRLGVIADGSTISLYINGTLLRTFADDSLTWGSVQVFVQAHGERAQVDVSRMTILTVAKAKLTGTHRAFCSRTISLPSRRRRIMGWAPRPRRMRTGFGRAAD